MAFGGVVQSAVLKSVVALVTVGLNPTPSAHNDA